MLEALPTLTEASQSFENEPVNFISLCVNKDISEFWFRFERRVYVHICVAHVMIDALG